MDTPTIPATPKKEMNVRLQRRVPFILPAERARLRNAFWTASNSIQGANGSKEEDTFTEENLNAYPVPLTPIKAPVGNTRGIAGYMTPERPTASLFGAVGALPHGAVAPPAPKKKVTRRRRGYRSRSRRAAAKK